MREIKFRAWEKHLREMIQVYSVNFERKMINTETAWRFIDTDVELMQYTGLKVNGNEIYEGDIIKFKHEAWDDSEAEVSEVIWYGNSECTYPAFDLNDSRLKGFYECNVLSFILTSGDYEVEVIGNIYEVSEILK